MSVVRFVLHIILVGVKAFNTSSSNRLLGLGHRDVMQLTSNLRDASQVLFTNHDVQLMPPDPDEFI